MLNVATKYGYSASTDTKNDPAPDQSFICGRTGIKKKFNELTDADCAKMIAAGNTNFKLRTGLTSAPASA